MATRIFIQCKTEKMPELLLGKIPLMADIACRKVWNRDFDKNSPNNDRLVAYGKYINTRSLLLIDNGLVDAKEYKVINLH